FLRFRKRPVSDRALFSGNDFALVFQRMTADAFAFRLQPLEPGHPVGHDLLKLRGRKTAVPNIAAKKQQVIGLSCCAHNSSFRLLYPLTQPSCAATPTHSSSVARSFAR